MKRGFQAALMPFLSVVMILGGLVMTMGGTGLPSATASAPTAPNADWVGPIDISNSNLYDNTTEVAASPLNGAVTAAWEQRDIGSSPSFNLITHASNSSMDAAFALQTLQRSGYKLSGAVQVEHDSLGRRHVVWYHNSGNSGSTVCGYYALIEADGHASIVGEQIPRSCGGNRKMSALAIGPDNSVHVLLGWIGNETFYYQRSPQGAWVVQEELLPEALGARVYPEAVTLAVSTNGVIMAGWKDISPTGSGSDIFTAVRNGTNNWTVEDISYSCCSGCPESSGAYTPSLAADRTGGFRMGWGDERCPRTGTRGIDVYYREWVPNTGWNNQPIVRIFRGTGEAYDISVAVDDSNRTHMAWSDDTGRASKNSTYFYATGTGTTFTAPVAPFANWLGDAYIKEPALDFAFGNLHTAFSSNRDDGNKDSYYAHLPVGPAGPPPTATPAPARCPGERFADVCPGDTFYSYIMNLVNLGVISGYSDNTFRPNNNLTRGQASKIVALAANLPANLQGAPHFTDVDQNNSFYEYVEFSYNAGVIAGYACGGPGEPCDAQRRAYFRPNNNVTRGQLSKMAAQAFGFNEQVSGQTFTDVPPTNTFYVYIERMARRGIIGGYSDGTFRPNAEVTRGQASKIIDGARLQPTATAFPTNTPTITLTSTMTSTATATSIIPTITATQALATTTVTEILPTSTTTEIIPTITVTLAAK
ncbi:MAG TPA: S-layer homology domain-containing protein [Chloroflexia bacterium]|nr:S-layer homology domain-containing protein [Chloroflexia bacterium]